MRDVGYAMCDLGYAMCDMRYAMWDTRCRIHDARFRIHDSGYTMQDTKSKELRAKSKEQRAKSKEQRAKSKELRAKNKLKAIEKPNILTYLFISSTFPLAKNDFGTLFFDFDIDTLTPLFVEMSKCQIVEVADYGSISSTLHFY